MNQSDMNKINASVDAMGTARSIMRNLKIYAAYRHGDKQVEIAGRYHLAKQRVNAIIKQMDELMALVDKN